jgi:hypothetical protein
MDIKLPQRHGCPSFQQGLRNVPRHQPRGISQQPAFRLPVCGGTLVRCVQHSVLGVRRLQGLANFSQWQSMVICSVSYLFSNAFDATATTSLNYCRCVQATLTSGIGCSNVPGDTQFHIFSLLYNGQAEGGDRNRTRFRFDFIDQPLTFAAGSSQSSNTGALRHITSRAMPPMQLPRVIPQLQASFHAFKLGANRRTTARTI